jgi:hypothetical protein
VESSPPPRPPLATSRVCVTHPWPTVPVDPRVVPRAGSGRGRARTLTACAAETPLGLPRQRISGTVE